MELLNELPEDKRKAITDYIARERDTAFANGMAEGRSKSVKETLVTFIRGSLKSKTIDTGLLLTAVGMAGEFHVEIEQFLRDNAQPWWASALGVLWMLYRYTTDKSIIEKGKK